MRKALAALAVAGAVAFASVTCPLDNSGMYFTGRTRMEWGKFLQEYRCPMGHTMWVVN